VTKDVSRSQRLDNKSSKDIAKEVTPNGEGLRRIWVSLMLLEPPRGSYVTILTIIGTFGALSHPL